MTNINLGFMSYNPITDFPNNGGTNLTLPSYAVQPLDIQVLYQKIFDVYCAMFPGRIPEFQSLLAVFSNDFRRTVLALETTKLKDEIKEFTEVFEAVIPKESK